MTSIARDPNSFKIVELKAILRSRGLSTAGVKAELVRRLRNSDPHGAWQCVGDEDEIDTMATTNDEMSIEATTNNVAGDQAGQRGEHEEARSTLQREIELCRREKELAERELALVQHELELLRMSRRDEALHDGQTTSATMMRERDVRTTSNAIATPERIATAQPRVNITAADLLCEFNGQAESFETWERQAKFLRAAYQLDDNLTKILIGTKLRGRASDWFHSKPEYIAMSDEVLAGLRGMFYHRPNRITLRRCFEERVCLKRTTRAPMRGARIIKVLRTIRVTKMKAFLLSGVLIAVRRIMLARRARRRKKE